MFFFAFIFGVPILIMFLVISSFIFIPFFAIRGTVRGVRRLANRPAPTDHLRRQLDDFSDAFPTTDAFARDHLAKLLAAWNDKLPLSPLFNRLIQIASTLYAANGFDPLAPPSPLAPDAIGMGRYRDEILSGLRTANDASRILAIIHATLCASFSELVRKLPSSSLATCDAINTIDEPQPLFRVSLLDMVRNPKQTVADLILPFQAPDVAAYKLFRGLREQLSRNLYEASGQHDPAPAHKLIHPYEHSGTPQQVVKAYLGYTPLQYLFDVDVPFPITRARRMEH